MAGFCIARRSASRKRADGPAMSIGSASRIPWRISTLLFVVLTAIAGLVLIGLVVMGLRLAEIRADLGTLRDNALPRLVKISQLSQEASATISIAPALSANPTRSEFETLFSRIKDKEVSQKALIGELGALFRDEDATRVLRRNADLLIRNLQGLTDVVRQQITVRKRLEGHIEFFRRLIRPLSAPPAAAVEGDTPQFRRLAGTSIFATLNTLLDPNRARFSRNRSQLEDSMRRLEISLGSHSDPAPEELEASLDAARKLAQYWSTERDRIYEDKEAELTNAFKIKAIVEENALIAGRLLSSANNEFRRASADLEAQIGLVDDATRFTLVAMAVVLVAFGAGNYFMWLLLQRRVLRRLDRMRDALQSFAETGNRAPPDPVDDEIGEISGSLNHYMGVIDEREAQLAEKTGALERLSSQLAKYLSPQVYDSIFSGKQEVKVASTRKKLTVFFSDIAAFTETADRLESEELTQLLNHYLTEMSRIALEHGATIDKYIGDAILIFVGDPETRGVQDDALACVRMAIDMRDRLHDLGDIWRQLGIEKPLQCRTGIHTGFCTVGNFGSEDRMDYTIIGGAVNTASRLESLAAPGEILISFETFAHVRDEVHCEEHGEIEVKGIAYPVATYRVVDTYENLGRRRRRFREDHPNVRLDLNLDAMTSKDRGQAEEILRRALDLLSQAERPGGPGGESGGGR